MSAAPFSAVLLDIEGTTTSISFVYDVLFPFARTHVESFIEENWGKDEIRTDISLFFQQYQKDLADGREDIFEFPKSGSGQKKALLENFFMQMDSDRKLSCLKSLQGKIWLQGYLDGELKGHVYPDVPKAMTRWFSDNIGIYIYSSGSVAAQKLLFSHSISGDLCPLISGYFDTLTGAKQDAISYKKISNSIGFEPQQILFLTDKVSEAEAATAAGMNVRISLRPGNPSQPEHSHRTIQSFSEI